MNKFALSTVVATSLAAMSFSAFAQSGEVEGRQERRVSSAASSDVAARNAWAARNLTPFRNQLLILAGPTSTHALGVNAPGLFGPGEFGLNINVWADNGFSDTSVGIPLGFAFAPIDDLEVGLGLPIWLSPGDFGNMPLWATYQFMDGNVQLGARLTLYLPTQSDFGIQLGLPLIFRTGKIRLDSGAYVTFGFSDPVLTNISVPLRMGWQMGDALYAGFQTGVQLNVANSFTDFSMPLYGFVGYTLQGGLGPIDLGFRFGFDRFVQAGDLAGDAINVHNFSFALGANVGLQF